jgi:hypothetical protein
VETGVKPYAGSSKLTISYLDEGERDLVVFSKSESVEEIREIVEADIQRRREALSRVLREHQETREMELNRLQLDLELAENLFALLEGLHGVVDWRSTLEVLEGIERIEAERETLSGSTIVKAGFEGLRSMLVKRHPSELKNEAWDSLESLFYGVYEASKYSPRWFDRRINYLLLSAIFRAWDIRLNSVVSGGTWEIDEGLVYVLDEVIERLKLEIGVELVRPSTFDSVRHLIYEVVELLLDVETKVSIATVDDLK